jgi:flagellar hook assembly protein FlgD
MQGGAHFINWDGTDSNGYQCKKGIYFVYLTLERKSNFINKIIFN